jgi:AcrR family transcriptional regulator
VLTLPPIGPRKDPKQDRSEAMVSAIVQAAAQLIAADGYAATSMTGVAQRAGVSIGSLYQYFQSKDALLTELARRVMHENASVFEASVDEAHGKPLDVGVTMLMRKVAGFVAEAYPLRVEFVRYIPRIVEESDTSVRDRYFAALERFLRPHAQARSLDDGIFNLIHAMEGILEASSRLPTNRFADPTYLAQVEAQILGLVRSAVGG